MKIRSIINYITLAVAFLLMAAGFRDDNFFMSAMLSAFITGIIQVFLALSMLEKRNSNLLNVYFLITVLYFILLTIFGKQFFTFIVPPALVILLTYIIYIERKKEKIINQN